jgi:hypothetical protein
MKPSSITNLRCKFIYVGDQFIAVIVEWDVPWNKVPVDGFSVWEHNTYKAYKTTENFVRIESPRIKPGIQVEAWVQWEKNGIKGPYSEKLECVIP